MMNQPSVTTFKKDTLLLSVMLLRLALPRLLTRLVVILGIGTLVVYCVKYILNSGSAWLEFGIKVSGAAEVLGKAVIDFILLYQKYFWWFVVAVLVVIALNVLISYLRGSLKRGRAALVPLCYVRKLCASLSPEGLDVLNWVWRDQTQPITVGILQTVTVQINSGRAGKLALARSQQVEVVSALNARPVRDLHSLNASLAPVKDQGRREPTRVP